MRIEIFVTRNASGSVTLSTVTDSYRYHHQYFEYDERREWCRKHFRQYVMEQEALIIREVREGSIY